ncbi:MAG: hemerythrin domain-containing protein [Flavobacteriales bacterium]|jgi:hemerythrin-like domain-containing protein|nr:hemerythrin domain-containing protein [Flavobacteriales bacterium]MCB0757415.1 hemerythrin domain-containing protein [Flavobacteriales bacterium]
MPPIDRLPELQGISREHHDGLLLCWKIRVGTAKGVAPSRIRRYCRQFLKVNLKPHFDLEENVLFPILGYDHPDVRRAMAEHRRLQRLINGRSDVVVALSLIEEELEAHIRFEERRLFDRIQKVATADQLAEVGKAHAESHQPTVSGRPEDVFWE